MKKLISILVLTIALFSTTSQLKASHFSGADLTYTCLGGNDYIITFTFYRDCAGMGEPSTALISFVCSSNSQFNFNVTLPKKSGPNGLEVTQGCSAVPTKCTNGTNYGFREWIYQAQVTLPPCNYWKMSYSLCCRNPNNTTTGGAIYIEAILNNSQAPCNSSPIFINKPLTVMCQGQTFNFNSGAIDLDGDSLTYEWIAPKTSATATVTYIGGYSYTQPIPSIPPVSINPITGDISITPTMNIISPVAILVKEWRKINGLMTNIGSVLRDLQTMVISCSNTLPMLSGMDALLTHTYNPSDTVFYKNVGFGQAISFDINGFDADTFNPSMLGHPELMTITWNNGIPAGTFQAYYNGTDSAYANFSWTPSISDISNTPHCFTATVKDDACPYNGRNTYSYCLRVKNIQTSHYAGADLSYTNIGGNNNKVKLALYHDCAGGSEPDSVLILFQCSSNPQLFFYLALQKKTGPNGIVVSNTCSATPTTCNGGSSYGVKEWIYEGQVSLTPCNSWVLSYSSCCRNSNQTTNGTDVYVESTLNNQLVTINSSPTFANKPIVVICKDFAICYGHGALDPDGDLLTYEFISPKTSENVNITYNAGLSYTQPLPSIPPVYINSVTGDICMKPTTSIVTIASVKITESRNINGTPTVVGTSTRDMQIKVQPCPNSLPVLSGMDTLLSHTYNSGDTMRTTEIFANSLFTFDINGFDADTFDANNIGHPEKMTISWNNGIADGTFTPYLNGTNSAYANFSWTPDSNDVSSTPHCFTATVKDDACPYNGSNTYSYCLVVKKDSGIIGFHKQNSFVDRLIIYPNPFNNELNIEYFLTKNSNIKIELLNILGERIKLITDDYQSSGLYNLKINSKENNLKEGIYILKIISDEFEINKKVVYN